MQNYIIFMQEFIIYLQELIDHYYYKFIFDFNFLLQIVLYQLTISLQNLIRFNSLQVGIKAKLANLYLFL